MIIRFGLANIQNIIVYILLFLSAMNFQAKFFYFAYAAFVINILGKNKLRIYRTTLLYLVLSILMAIYNRNEGMLSMIRCMSYSLLYILGFNLINSSKRVPINYGEIIRENTEKKVFHLLVVLASGSFIHYILNFITNTHSIIGRNTIDIWSGEVMAATGQAVLSCLMIAVSIAMILVPYQRMNRVVGGICIIIAFAYNLVLGGRTIIVLSFVLLVIGFLYANKIIKSFSKKMKLVISLFTIGMVALIVISTNKGGIQEYILNSNLFQRFDISFKAFAKDSARTSAKISFIRNAYRYPFGGLHLRQEYGYAHDLLLDGYDEYGILGLVMILLILICGIMELYKLLKLGKYSNEFKVTLLCVYITFLLIFCVEPILTGMNWFFCLYCIVNGCIAGMNRVNSTNVENGR